MSLTIVLSGPGGFEAQARKSLADAGFGVHETTVSHNLPDRHDGTNDPTVTFLSVDGDDIDTAHAAVEPLKWTLRAHYPASVVTSPLLVDQSNDHEAWLRKIIREEMARGS